MPFWKCYYHIVWATWGRLPAIEPQFETVIYAAIHEKSLEKKSHILAVQAMPGHLHLAVNIPPALSIAEYVRMVKGISAWKVNEAFSQLETAFRWQAGYGVLTFGERALPVVKDYIENQHQHHDNNTISYGMENIEE